MGDCVLYRIPGEDEDDLCVYSFVTRGNFSNLRVGCVLSVATMEGLNTVPLRDVALAPNDKIEVDLYRIAEINGNIFYGIKIDNAGK